MQQYPEFIPSFFYNNVEEGEAPLTAGTYDYKVCTTCIDDNGNIIQVLKDTPHPVWTNGMGKAVIQSEMVTLGGIDGLNS